MKMRKVMAVLLIVPIFVVCVSMARSDTLILKRDDGSTFIIEGKVKSYEDKKLLWSENIMVEGNYRRYRNEYREKG